MQVFREGQRGIVHMDIVEKVGLSEINVLDFCHYGVFLQFHLFKCNEVVRDTGGTYIVKTEIGVILLPYRINVGVVLDVHAIGFLFTVFSDNHRNPLRSW